MNLFGNLLTITYRCLRSCQISKALRKTSIISFTAIEGKIATENTIDGGYNCCVLPDVGEGALEYNMPITS